ncbi:hypothetical protein JW968_03965 [Candidatus Woesearchaeota archaeon]|nr:hypothetical protein [Candidatus Woesearchaeota archaeon]
METKIILTALIFLVSISMVYAMQPPCSDSQLLDSSTFAIEGMINDKICGKPYKGGIEQEDCYEMIKDCTFKIEVTNSLKGDYEAGDIVGYNTQLFHSIEGEEENCAGGGPRRFGNDLKVGQSIRYYKDSKHANDETGGLAGMSCQNYIWIIEDASAGPIQYGKCGDNVCDYGENTASYPYYCPQDCGTKGGPETGVSCEMTGLRRDVRYCSPDYIWLSQKQTGEACENNFECSSDFCVSGKCISNGLLQKILNWFKGLVGAD